MNAPALDIHNKNLSAILNNLSIAFMIMDARGKIEFFNPLAEKITEYSASEAREMKHDDLFRPPLCKKDSSFKDSDRSREESSKREMILKLKDKSSLPVECTTSTIIDTNGIVTGSVEIFKDISKIKLLEDDLRHSEFKYRR